MDKKTSLPDGVTCPTCERRAKFSAWLFAHWNDEAIHTCACGTRLGLRCGVITFLKPPRAFHIAAGADLDDFGRRYRTPRRAAESDAAYRFRIISTLKG